MKAYTKEEWVKMLRLSSYEDLEWWKRCATRAVERNEDNVIKESAKNCLEAIQDKTTC